MFAHIVSDDGVLGHAAEVKEMIPAGVFLTMPPHLHRLTPWMIKKCGFHFISRIEYEGQEVDILQKD